MKYFALTVLSVVLLAGCTAQQVQQTMTTVKTDVALSAEVVNGINTVAQAAAPGTALATDMAKANVTVQHINGAVQTVTITLPAAAAPATVPGAPAN